MEHAIKNHGGLLKIIQTERKSLRLKNRITEPKIVTIA